MPEKHKNIMTWGNVVKDPVGTQLEDILEVSGKEAREKE
jgi:hypothetical protein